VTIGAPVQADSTSAVKSRRPCASALRRRSSRHAHNTAAAARAMDAMMTMKKIDIARIEAARRG
jgi:hypothetical protein